MAPPQPEQTAITPLRRALRLAIPAAVASVVVAAFATTDPGSVTLALGVACGVLSGAAVASLFRTPGSPQRDEPIPRELVPIEPTRPPTERAEIALGSGREVLRRLPAALILLDARGRVAFCNDAATHEIGPELEDQHFSSSLRAPGMVDAVARAYQAQEASTFSFTRRRGQERHLAATVIPLTDAGSDLRVMIVVEDQTRIRRAERLHRDFVANASHELKTPLASISGFIETLQSTAKGDLAAQEKFLGIMAQQAQRMARLVEDLLSLNRIELNEHVAPRDVVDLRAVLADAVELGTPAGAPANAVDVETTATERLVRGDRRELTQLFANLVDNAVKYGGVKRPVVVRFRMEPERDGFIGVTVEDFGPGIAKDDLPRLTERFYRVDVPASRNKGGTGLGLAIVKHVVARHRGALSIESDLGRGAQFTVWLPEAVEEREIEARGPRGAQPATSASDAVALAPRT